MRRRDLLVIGGLVGTAVAIPPYLRRRADVFEFQPLEGFAGYRRLEWGSISASFDVFAGLSEPAEPYQFPEPPFCDALFGTTDWTEPSLPVAVFGDVNCPNCAAFESRLARIQRDTKITVIHHQLPLLGPSSERAARLILAAGLQGSADVVYQDLLGSVLRPGPVGARAVATRHGLDGDRLWEDANGPQVADLLGKALGLGAALGIPGTPSSMIGRTLAIGALSDQDLIRLIELEQSEPLSVC